MELRKNDAVFVGRRFFFAGLFVHNDVFFERDFAVVDDLFEPGEAVAVRGEGGDDVVLAVTVDVVGVHMRAAMTGSERKLMLFPNGVSSEGVWLFPPAIFFDQVEFAVAVHVANARTMTACVIVVL